ncbi:MAG: lipid-A-disaccharide synthase N-terminal domain-containing protein [Phycisphaerae bacterium]|nr:lipid-A-disaccharide synthase N-terminal domain-containing protein [Phycisphaerae bacterium]
MAQFAFMMRFVLQLIASERKKRSYVPVAFWYLSLVGGTMLFIYAFKLRDPVFILGQGLGCLIYIRNLLLIRKRKWALRELQALRRERALQGNPRSNSPQTPSDPPVPDEPPTPS